MDSQDNIVPTYDQNVIMGMARVLTGWNYWQTNQANGLLPSNFFPPYNPTNYMVLVPTHHELGTKLLLDNVMLPAAQGNAAISGNTTNDNYCSQDLELALDSIFNNQNVGPFICRQLIHRLVTSNPSRDYLYRVVQVFNDNGSGVRGDLKAVISAILMDYEARCTTFITQPTFGKQREPLLRATAAARAFRPPASLNCTYSQNGDRPIFITNSTAHRLNNGDTVFLTFTDTSGQSAPSTKAFSVQSVPTTNTFTVNAPGLSSGTYTQTANVTISNMVTSTTVTTNVIFVTVNGHGLSPGNPVYLSFNNTVAYTQTANMAISNMVTSTMVTTNVITVTLASHGFIPGNVVYLDFTSGGAANGSYQVINTATNGNSFSVSTTEALNRSGNVLFTPANASSGTYQVVNTTNANSFFVLTPNATNLTGNVLMPKFALSGGLTSGGYQPSGTTVNVSTYDIHGLHVGDYVFIHFKQGNIASGQYQITSVPNPTHFTVTSTNSTSTAYNSLDIYPLVAPTLVRSGTLAVRFGTWNIGSTDSGSTYNLEQSPLNSPTVFNFFFPDYQFPGLLTSAGLTTPEFQLTSDTTVALQMNFLEGGILNNSNNTNGMTSFNNHGGSIVLDVGPWMTAGYTSNAGVPGLVDGLSSLLMGGQLSSASRTTIINYIINPVNFPTTSSTYMRDRVQAAVHLLLCSPDFTIQK